MSSLKKAQIEIVDGAKKGKKIEFLYNPDSISYSKEFVYHEKPRSKTNVGNIDIGGGRGAVFSISRALFDTTLPKSLSGKADVKDVRTYTDDLIELMKIDDDLGKPPACKFKWGAFISFAVRVTSVALTFDYFAPNGTPLRAYADIRFRQATDEYKLERQNPTSGSYARKIWTVLEGETLDWIAYQEYGDANAWRHIAEVNNLNDPMNLHPGQLLKLTPLE